MVITEESLIGTFEQKRELVRQFNLMDDTFFSVVMEDKDSCEYLLRKLLKKDDLKVKRIKTQFSIRNETAHSVVLDVFAEDSTGKLYNIEVQVADNSEEYDLKRVRCYSANVDSRFLPVGEDYQNIPDLYVIFITAYDIFGLKRNNYYIDRVIRGTDKVVDNGLHEIYFNTKIKEDNEFDDILQYLKNSDPDNQNFGSLSKCVYTKKETEEGVGSMCKAVEDYAKKKAESAKAQGIAQGKAEGIAEGKAEGKAEAIKAMKGMTYEEFLEFTKESDNSLPN